MTNPMPHRLPEPGPTVPDQLYGRMLLIIVFTVVQVCAVALVLVEFRADGVARCALALALSGALVAVLDSWRELRALVRRRRADHSVPDGGGLIVPVRTE